MSHYECSACKKLRKSDPNTYGQFKIPIIAIENATNIYRDDPLHPRNQHFCTPMSATEVEVEQGYRRARRSAKTGVRPRRAYRDMQSDMARDYAHDHQQRDNMLGQVKVYGKVRSRLYKAFASNYPTIRNLNEIPEYLLKTYRG